MKARIAASLIALASAFPVAATAGEDSSVAYPQGYRGWTHVKSMVIQQGHPLYDSFGGIHHIYANAAALEGYRDGHFPDGAVIVFDLLEAQTKGNAITEGARKVLGVMEKDRDAFHETGGWGFEGFGSGEPGNRVVGSDAKTACFQCHTAKANSDYVFSAWRD